MKQLRKTEELVEDVLRRFEYTRSDDCALIFAVYREINYNVAIVDRFSEIMLNRKSYGFPSFESITRSRRKVFEKHPELKPVAITKKRKEREEQYRRYARI